MKNKKTIALTVASFAISALAMVGSTVAWFQAMNTANVAFQGTVVQADAKLDIGFRVSGTIDNPEDLGLVLEGGIYWAPNTVSPAIMDAVFAAGEYAEDNMLTPITTGSYESGDEAILPFYTTPVFDANRGLDEVHVELDEQATKAHYVGFSVVFRRMDAGRENGLEDSEIYFDTNTSIKGEGVSADALRLGFKNLKDATTDIIKPDATAAGTINVGGVMDLNGDGANDYTLLEYEIIGEDLTPTDQCEIAYGEFEEALEDSDWGVPSTDGVIPTPFANVDEDFTAGKTAFGVRPLLVEAAKPKEAEYNSFEAYTVNEDDNAPIAVTDEDGLAEVNFVLWLEGWDPACTNAIAEASYGAVLTFVSVDA